MGMYIHMSGLDHSLIKVDIYCQLTMEKNKEGKHMKVGIKSFSILPLNFHNLYIEHFLITDKVKKKWLNNAVKTLIRII